MIIYKYYHQQNFTKLFLRIIHKIIDTALCLDRCFVLCLEYDANNCPHQVLYTYSLTYPRPKNVSNLPENLVNLYSNETHCFAQSKEGIFYYFQSSYFDRSEVMECTGLIVEILKIDKRVTRIIEGGDKLFLVCDFDNIIYYFKGILFSIVLENLVNLKLSLII